MNSLSAHSLDLNTLILSDQFPSVYTECECDHDMVHFDVLFFAHSDQLDMWKVLAASIAALMAYRIVAAWKMWEITSLDGIDDRMDQKAKDSYKWLRWRRVALQLLDLELYPILFLSHTVGFEGSSAPQRMLSLLEAVLESGPQV